MAKGGTIEYGIKFNLDKTNLNALKTSLMEINKLTAEKIMNINPEMNLSEAIGQLNQVKGTAEIVENALKNAFNPKIGTLNLNDFNLSLSKANLDLNSIYKQFASVGVIGQQSFRNLTTELLTTNLQLKQSHNLLDEMATTMGNTIKWGIASSLMNNFTNSISKAYNYIVKLDTSLNDIRIVTNKSAEEMGAFAEQANKVAQSLGASTRDYTEASLIYYQQGLSDEESAARAEVTLKAANVTGQTGQEVSEQLTAVWNGYKVTAEEAELYVDKLAAVAAATASDLEELSTGMSKVASAADLMGVDIDQLNATLATVVSVTRQAPESVGTAFKTIYARMGDIEAGLDAETTLGSYTEKMKEIAGINVLDTNNQLRDMGEVIEEVGNKWTTLSREQQVALSQAMAGTRQYNNLLSLFDNWDMYQDALSISEGAAGTLQQQQDIYMESAAAHIQQMKTSFEGLYDSLLDEDSIIAVTDALTNVVNLLTNLVDALGGGANTLLAFGSIATRVFSKNLAQGIAITIDNIKRLKINTEQLTATYKMIEDILKGPAANDQVVKQLVSMKQEILNLGNVVTQEQHNEANAIINKVNELEKQKLAYEQSIDAAKEFLAIQTEGQPEFDLSGIESQDDQVWREANKALEDIQENIKKTKKDISGYQKVLDDVYGDFGTDTKEASKNVEELKGHMKNLVDSIKSFSKDGKYSSSQIKKLSLAVSQYQKALSSGTDAEITAAADNLISVYTKVWTQIENDAKKTEQTLKNIGNRTGQSISEEIERIKTEWDSFIANSKTAAIAKQFIELAGVVGQLASGFSTLLNISEIWNNQDLSTTEKMLQIMMALTTAIPMIANGIMSITPLLYSVGVSLGVVKAVADGATLSFSAMWGALLGPVAIAVAAIVGIIAVIGSVIDIISSWQTEEEKLQAEIQRTKEEVQKANKAYQELNDTINGYTDAKNNIKNLEEGTVEFYEAIITANEKAQELVDTLGLLPGSGYTIGANGLINIDEDVLEDALYRQMQEIYRNQAKNTQATADLEIYNRDQIVSDFRNEVNRMALEQGIQTTISQEQAEEILKNTENTNINLGELGSITKEYHSSSLMALNENNNVIRESYSNFNSNLNDLNNDLSSSVEQASSQASQNICTAVNQNAIDISSAIAKYSSEYNVATERINTYERQAAIENLRGYADQTEISQYEKLSTGSQEAVAEILRQQKENNQRNVNESITEGETIGFKWYDILTLGTTAAWRAGRHWGTADARQEVKEEYAKNALGYTENGNETWTSPEGKILDRDEMQDVIDSIDTETARLAYNSGEYYVKDAYKNFIQPTIERAAVLATEKNLDSTSQSYIEEALLRLQAGTMTDEFAATLTDEEKRALFSQRGQTITLYEDGSQETADTIQGVEISAQYSSEDINNWLALTGEVNRSAERIKADLQDYNNTLKASAQNLETTTKALEFFGKAMYNASDETNNMNKSSAEAIVDQYEFNKAYNNAVGVFYDTEEAIEAYTDALENGENISYDVADAMGELAESLENIGLSLDVDTISGNLDTIQTLLTGTQEEAEEAYIKLLTLAQMDTLENLFGPAEDALNSFGMSYNTLINGIQTTNPGTYLADNYASALQKMITDTQLTAEQIQALAKQLNIEIPIEYNVPDEIAIKDNVYTTAATTTAHTYSGQIPVPDADEETGYRLEDINYSWYETTEPKTEHFISVDTTKMKVSQNSKSLGGSRNFSLSQSNKNSKSSGGGGGSSSSEPDRMDPLEEEADRYHSIETQITKVGKSLDRLSSKQEKFVGQKLIDNLNEQWALLNTQIENYNKKLGIAIQEQEELRSKLASKGVAFNQDGTIGNYASAFQAQQNYVNSLIAQYNSMSAAGQESFKATVEAAQESFDKFKEDLDRYDELVSDFIPSIYDEIEQAFDQQIEINVQKFNMELEITLDMNEATREWNEWKKKVLDGIDEDDILGNSTAKLEDFYTYFNEKSSGDIQGLSKKVLADLEELKALDEGRDNVFGDDKQQGLDVLKEDYEQLMESLSNLVDLQDELYENIIEEIDIVQEKFDDQIESYEAITDMIEHDMKLIQLLYGEDSYGELAQYYEMQQKNYEKQLEFQQQQKDFWYAQMQAAEQGSEAWETARDNWSNAVSEFNSLLESSLENATSKFENSINNIFKNLNNSVTNGMGLDYVQEEWELINKNAEQYLDTVNATYGIRELEKKYIDSINNADSVKVQQQLKKAMDQQLENLKQKDKLTQYDLDRANKLYEIQLAQIALEEAQQNKSQMRLRRDSQGNYTYQYVADEDAITDAENQLANLYNDLYNFDKQRYQENLEQIYSLWNEYQEKMREAALINDPELRAEKELLIQEQYGELINGIVEENESIRHNLQESTFLSLSNLYEKDLMNFSDLTQQERDLLLNEVGGGFTQLLEIYGVNTEAFKNMTQEQQNALIDNIINGGFNKLLETYNLDLETFKNMTQEERDAMIANMGEAFNKMLELYGYDEESFKNLSKEKQDDLISKMGFTFDTLSGFYDNDLEAFRKLTEDQQSILVESMVPQWNSAIQEMAKTFYGENGFEKNTINAWNAIKDAQKEYQEDLDKLEEVAKENFENIKNGIDENINIIQDPENGLLKANKDLIEAYEKELAAVIEVYNKVKDLRDMYAEAEQKAKDAAEAAYAYQQQEAEKNRQDAANQEISRNPAGGADEVITPVNPTPPPSQPVYRGPQGNGSVDIGDRVTLTGKLARNSYASPTITPLSKYRGAQLYVQMKTDEGRAAPYHLGTTPNYSSRSAVGWVNKWQISGYDTGGYTGEWNKDGKLAFLHQKELVLNEQDTKNMLNAVSIIRSLAYSLGTNMLSKLAGVSATGYSNQNTTNSALEQNVHIQAEFPNVKDASEIEEALNNLVNKASQRIMEK